MFLSPLPRKIKGLCITKAFRKFSFALSWQIRSLSKAAPRPYRIGWVLMFIIFSLTDRQFPEVSLCRSYLQLSLRDLFALRTQVHCCAVRNSSRLNKPSPPQSVGRQILLLATLACRLQNRQQPFADYSAFACWALRCSLGGLSERLAGFLSHLSCH